MHSPTTTHYKKFNNEKPPKSPNKTFKFHIQRLLSNGSSKSGSSSPNSPSSPNMSPNEHRKSYGETKNSSL